MAPTTCEWYLLGEHQFKPSPTANMRCNREHRAVQPRPAPGYCVPEGDKWQDKDGVRKAYLVWGSKSSAFPKQEIKVLFPESS